MAMLYDKGLFCYDDKIAQHWPNFGQNGKENIEICDVLRHESGLAHFSESIPTIKNAWYDNIKLNKIGAFIEKEKQHFPRISKTEYHALSRGLILNEVIRRIDPKVSRYLQHLQEFGWIFKNYDRKHQMALEFTWNSTKNSTTNCFTGKNLLL